MTKGIVCAVLASVGIVLPINTAMSWETTANFVSSSENGTKKGFVAQGTAPDNPTVEPPSEYNVPFPDDSVVFLGEGFDLITGQRKPTYCVTRGQTAKVPFYNKTASISEVTDEESLYRKLNKSVAANGKYAGYSGGGSYQDSVETTLTTKDINIVAKADVRSYAISMKLPEQVKKYKDLPTRRLDLTEEAIRLIREGLGKYAEMVMFLK